MPPRPISTYSDVAPLWATAEKTGYLKMVYETESQAIYVNQRLNALRAKLRVSLVPGLPASSTYDHLIVRRRGAELEIIPRPVVPAKFFDAYGYPINLDDPITNDLSDDVLEARHNLGFD